MMSWIRRSARLAILRPAPLLMAAVALTACDDDTTDPGDVFTWEGELEGIGSYEDLIGAVAAVSNESAFTAGIEIAQAPAEAVLTWTVAEGSCAAPGDAVGSAESYPDLEVDDEGEAAAEADVTDGLDEDGDYIVTVTDESGDDPVTVACGALVRE